LRRRFDSDGSIRSNREAYLSSTDRYEPIHEKYHLYIFEHGCTDTLRSNIRCQFSSESVLAESQRSLSADGRVYYGLSTLNASYRFSNGGIYLRSDRAEDCCICPFTFQHDDDHGGQYHAERDIKPENKPPA